MSGTFPEDEDIDYSDIEAKYRVQSKAGLDNIIVVDGVPVIDESKLQKLLAKISKEFSKKGVPFKLEKAHVPWNNSSGKSTGYIFIEFNTPEEAERAKFAMEKHPFDAKHRFSVNLFSEFEEYTNTDETYVEPEPEEFNPREHLRAWLADPHGRDQYAIYKGDDVNIFWHGKPAQTEIAYEASRWTELYLQWSPLGTMIATIHRQGVKLWGGPSFQQLQKFPHPMVRRIDFSPDERYLVTFERITIPDNPSAGPNVFPPKSEGDYVAVWDVKTGQFKRSFPRVLNEGEDEHTSKQATWPAIKWSPDGRYVAQIAPGKHISVYSLPDFRLVDKPVPIDGVVDFEWRPLSEKEKEKEETNPEKQKKELESIFAYWTPEIGNQPARVTLMSFPSRNQLRSKNLFNVSDCKLFWQTQGDYLCVKVDRHTKTKKSIFCNLEIFRLREKDFPVEVIELKETVIEFAWEPKGDRFIILTSNEPNLGATAPGTQVKTDAVFYRLDRARNEFRDFKTIGGRTTNVIRWSPKGRHVVLATLGSTSKSDIEFFDLDFKQDDLAPGAGTQKEDAPQLLGTIDHYGVTDIEWDPSGRFVATSVSSWRHSVENGYSIWDWRAQEQQRHLVEKFKQFAWRPRPPSLLSKEKKKEVRKDLRKWSKIFDEEDAAMETNVSAELIQARRRAINEWNAWRIKVKGELQKTKTGDNNQEEPMTEIVVLLDEVMGQTEEIVE